MGRDDEVVLALTGNGMKAVEAMRDVAPDAPEIPPNLAALAALVA